MLREEFNPKPKREPPFCLRLSKEERSELERLAGSRPLGEYIKDLIFHEKRRPKRVNGHFIANKQLFLKLLNEIAKSRISQNINQLAKAANSGSLDVTLETEKALMEAVEDIRWLRQTCMESLDTKPTKARKWQELQK